MNDILHIDDIERLIGISMPKPSTKSDFKQYDVAYKHQNFLNGETLKKQGCLVTTMANILKDIGIETIEQLMELNIKNSNIDNLNSKATKP
jgi:hypothetical protein